MARASEELADVLRKRGTTNENFQCALENREAAERELIALSRELSGGNLASAEFDMPTLSTKLGAGAVAVGFRRFRDWRVEVLDAAEPSAAVVRKLSTDRLCAFVCSSAAGAGPSAGADTNVVGKASADAHRDLTLVDLGPIEPIERAVHEWRDAIGIKQARGITVIPSSDATDLRARGNALRKLVFDPLLPTLDGANRVVLALDDVLHLVPFDALPLDGDALLGDRWHIETRATLWELLAHPSKLDSNGELLALGGVSYEPADDTSHPVEASAPTNDAATRAKTPSILRGSVWSDGFDALPGTKAEVDAIASAFANASGSTQEPHLLTGTDASKAKMLELAPRARWLHVETHGWFGSESMRSWLDPEPLDKWSGLGMRSSGEARVKGMNPMLLCDLALAGANAPEDALGRARGLITAEEIAALDLSNCELAVLSACDTALGEMRRAGQGVASLQKALQMAGARSVITSLWKVPDGATKELMVDFYQRMWRDKKSKSQALWEAKMRLRDARTPSGEPRYSTRDWAAWVLTGEPD